jgi:hypothetical protein
MASSDGRLRLPPGSVPRYHRNDGVSPAAFGVGKDQALFASADRL